MPRAPKKSAGRKSVSPPPVLRGKVWVEVGGRPALTEPGADLLEQIVACGSLSEAARRLRFAYRRAWMLVDAMNALWPEPLVTKATGGTGGGGTQLTPYGRHVLTTYRDIQIRIEQAIGEMHEPFGPADGTRVS